MPFFHPPSLYYPNALWSKGPWSLGAKKHGHCRIYSLDETHAIARTYGEQLNGITCCSKTTPQNAIAARMIAAAPDMTQVIALLSLGGYYARNRGATQFLRHHMQAWHMACEVITQIISPTDIPELNTKLKATDALIKLIHSGPWTIEKQHCIRDSSGTGICQLTGLHSPADATLIVETPAMAGICLDIYFDLRLRAPDETEINMVEMCTNADSIENRLSKALPQK